MEEALLICLIVANLLCCIKNEEQWREGENSLLLAVNSVLNPVGAAMCVLALAMRLT